MKKGPWVTLLISLKDKRNSLPFLTIGTHSPYPKKWQFPSLFSAPMANRNPLSLLPTSNLKKTSFQSPFFDSRSWLFIAKLGCIPVTMACGRLNWRNNHSRLCMGLGGHAWQAGKDIERLSWRARATHRLLVQGQLAWAVWRIHIGWWTANKLELAWRAGFGWKQVWSNYRHREGKSARVDE